MSKKAVSTATAAAAPNDDDDGDWEDVSGSVSDDNGGGSAAVDEVVDGDEDDGDWETASDDDQYPKKTSQPTPKFKKTEQQQQQVEHPSSGAQKGRRNAPPAHEEEHLVQAPSPMLVDRDGIPTYTSPIMIAATKKAQETFRFFIRELIWENRRIVKGCTPMSVKVCLRGSDKNSRGQRQRGANATATTTLTSGKIGVGEAIEHVWLRNVEFDGKFVMGELANKPSFIKGYNIGDVLSTPLHDIEDWIFGLQGVAYGGFTVAVIRASMKDAGKRKAHDDAWGLEFCEDPNQVRLFYAEGKETEEEQKPDEAKAEEESTTGAPAKPKFSFGAKSSSSSATASGSSKFSFSSTPQGFNSKKKTATPVRRVYHYDDPVVTTTTTTTTSSSSHSAEAPPPPPLPAQDASRLPSHPMEASMTANMAKELKGRNKKAYKKWRNETTEFSLLHEMAFGGAVGMVTLLLESGLFPLDGGRTPQGYTGLDLATLFNHQHVVECFEKQCSEKVPAAAV